MFERIVYKVAVTRRHAHLHIFQDWRFCCPLPPPLYSYCFMCTKDNTDKVKTVSEAEKRVHLIFCLLCTGKAKPAWLKDAWCLSWVKEISLADWVFLEWDHTDESIWCRDRGYWQRINRPMWCTGGIQYEVLLMPAASKDRG